jgi:hypothetical protein
MIFEWDPVKRRRNLEKHGIDFVDAQEVFQHSHIVVRSDRKGEERFTATGQAGEVIITIAYTVRGSNIRIISARKARDYEREKYRSLHQ